MTEANQKTGAPGGAPQNEEEAAILRAQTAGERKPIDTKAAEEAQARIERETRERNAEIERRSIQLSAEIHQRYVEQEKLRPLPPIMQAVNAKVARPDDDVVMMNFPRPMFIWAEPTGDQKRRLKVSFHAGLQEVPASLADNWYLRAAGVRKVERSSLQADPSKGPTVEEYVLAGYDPHAYPPRGFDSRSSQDEIDAACRKWDADHSGDGK